MENNDNEVFEKCNLNDFFEEVEKQHQKNLEFDKKHPIFSKIINYWYQFSNPGPIWWLKYRLIPRHRYHVVKTNLKPGYHDPRTRILHAVFCDFESWALSDYHTDGYIVSGKINIPKNIVGDAKVSYDNGTTASEEDIEYYKSKKDMFDDLREAYVWWTSINRNPEKWIEDTCFIGDGTENNKYKWDIDLENKLEDEIADKLQKVIKHYRNLWN